MRPIEHALTTDGCCKGSLLRLMQQCYFPSKITDIIKDVDQGWYFNVGYVS